MGYLKILDCKFYYTSHEDVMIVEKTFLNLDNNKEFDSFKFVCLRYGSNVLRFHEMFGFNSFYSSKSDINGVIRRRFNGSVDWKISIRATPLDVKDVNVWRRLKIYQTFTDVL